MPVTPGPGVGGLSQAAGFPAGAAVMSVALKKASSAEELASCCSSESLVFDFLVNPKCASRLARLLFYYLAPKLSVIFSSYLYLKIK